MNLNIKFLMILYSLGYSLSVTSSIIWAADSQKRLLDPQNLGAEETKNNLPKLYNVLEDSASEVKGVSYLPNRVYKVYVQEKKAWYFSKTNSRGKFLVPLELLDANTVLPGPNLGAKDPAVRYKLSTDWKWSISKEAEEYFLWVLSKPQVLKHISFQPVP